MRKIRVAVYARVSTEHEEQLSALENQIQYYDEIIARHPDWELYQRYIDEGITGTSVNKRTHFLKMMDDARHGKFDLIITREVARFARNTVDTLRETRILKSYGIEVWFIEDNIWTMNDSDGELRLSIMASLAQNESKKTSMRVKAGQRVSFLNGVVYGNGNILGYDRVGKEMVINPEQAATVRRIFDLYLAGYGSRKIQYILEQEHRKTAMGKEKWSASVIMKILKNPFYCGRIVYRKEYVPDYLVQKKVRNKGEVEQIIVMGKHVPIVTEEEFDRVQAMIAEITTTINNRNYGKPKAKNIWVKKTECICGHRMNRRASYVSTSGNRNYTFQCHDQLRTGTVRTRQNKGLSIDGICTNNTFSQWKLEVQADFIFRKLMEDKQVIYDTAIAMLESSISLESSTERVKKTIDNNIAKINKLESRMDVLLDMCTDGDISRETFNAKKESMTTEIKSLREQNMILRKEIEENAEKDELNEKIEALSKFLDMDSFSRKEPIPETIIDAYVQKIIYDHGTFTWILSPGVCSVPSVSLQSNGRAKKTDVPNVTMCCANSSTGSYQLRTVIENPIFLGSYNVSKSYMRQVIGFYRPDFRFEAANDITLVLKLA